MIFFVIVIIKWHLLNNEMLVKEVYVTAWEGEASFCLLTFRLRWFAYYDVSPTAVSTAGILPTMTFRPSTTG